MNHLVDIARGIIEAYGYAGIFVMTFTEQFIQPVPADLFITLGTSFGLPFGRILWTVLIAAFLGSYAGYFLGKYLGHPVIRWLFGQKRLDEGERFIKKWGMWGVIVAGLTPIPFKIVTWTAGIFEMPLGKYTLGILIGRMPRYLITAYAGSLIIKTKFYASVQMSAILLGALQGVTEFLPISSSGHLILMERFLKLPVPASDLATFDILLHGGSFLALVLYFWRDWLTVLKELWQIVTGGRWIKNSLASGLILGTVPAILAGLAFGHWVRGPLRGLTSVAIAFLLVAAFFLYAEWKSRGRDGTEVTLKKAVLIGAAQAVALVPGISRSGITIGAGMLTGLRRDVAARFSFLLGGIALLAANVYALISLKGAPVLPDLSFTLIGTATSFVVSLFAIHWLLRFLRHHTLRPFAFYLMILGGVIISVL